MPEWLREILIEPMFSIALSILTFALGLLIAKKTKFALANPLFISMILIISFLKLTDISYIEYNEGGQFINMFLAPVTASLAVPIYHKIDKLKKYLLPILIGTLVGCATSIISVKYMCKLFGFDKELTLSLLPKSVTTAIATDLSATYKGIPSITILAVVATGIMGAILAPLLIKIFKIKEPIAIGVSIGTCSHAVGTSKAIELGETEGAMSGIAIGMAGIMTVILANFLF